MADVVLRRRESAALAKLMREKRELDVRAEAYKGVEPRLAALAAAQQLYERGDHGGAVKAALTILAGDEARAKEALPKAYESLTSEILGVESSSQQSARVQRDLASLHKQLGDVQSELATRRAERDQMAAEVQERQIAEGVQSLATVLDAAKSQYPNLMAEADDPAQVVWEMMVEALERGEKPPEWEEAAKILDSHYQPIVEKKKNRYQHLLAPQGANGSPSKPEMPSSQMGSRKSLTNADAASTSDLQPPKPILNREDSIEQAFRLLQERTLRQT